MAERQTPHYFIITDDHTWGRGPTEKDAMDAAHYRQGKHNAFLYLLTGEPKDFDINFHGQLMWTQDVDLIALWSINKGSGKREQLHPQQETVSTTNEKG